MARNETAQRLEAAVERQISLVETRLHLSRELQDLVEQRKLNNQSIAGYEEAFGDGRAQAVIDVLNTDLTVLLACLERLVQARTFDDTQYLDFVATVLAEIEPINDRLVIQSNAAERLLHSWVADDRGSDAGVQ